MKYLLIAILSIMMALAATNVAALEQSESNKGSFNNVLEEYNQLVVDDQIYALGKTVWIDGTKYPVDRVKELLDKGDTIELELSGERRGGYGVVTRIKTNP